MRLSEIIFEAAKSDEGGYEARASDHRIFTQGGSIEAVRFNVMETGDCYFEDTIPRPKLIRLRFVCAEGLVA